MNYFATRRGLLMATLGTPLIKGCLWPRFFDLGWEEEVQLHDGRVIVVKVKYTYERLGGGITFNRYEPSILRDTEISFDAGPQIGRFNQLFQKHRIDLIEYFNGKWYFLLETVGGSFTVETVNGRKEAWGSIQNASGHKCWSLDQKGLSQSSINDLPVAVLKINMLMDFAPPKTFAKLDGTYVTLAQKAVFVESYPLNPSDVHIERPQTNLTKPQ